MIGYLKIIKWVVIVAAIITVVSVFRSCRHNRITLKQVKANVTKDTTTHWKDKYDVEHAKNNDIVVNRDAATILFSKKIDSLKDRLHLRDKQIKDILETTISVSGNVDSRIDTVTIHDTVNGVPVVRYALSTDYSDSLVAIGVVLDSEFHIRYDINNIPLKFTGYWKRKWFLGKKHFYVDAFSEHPNVHIKELTKITIEKDNGR